MNIVEYPPIPLHPEKYYSWTANEAVCIAQWGQSLIVKKDAQIVELQNALLLAVNRLKDMLHGDDGQAWKEAEKALPYIERVLESRSSQQ